MIVILIMFQKDRDASIIAGGTASTPAHVKLRQTEIVNITSLECVL